MTLLAPNQIYAPADQTDRPVRILAIPAGGILYYIELWDVRAMPKVCEKGLFEARTNEGDLVFLPNEPDYIRTPADSELTPAALATRDERYQKIRQMVDDAPLTLLDPVLRHKVVRQTVERLKTNKTHLYQYLRMWWRGGQLPNALAPKYFRCGGKGVERTPGKTKRGRPAILAGTDRGIGINVTPATAENLRNGAKLLKKGASFQQAYDRVMLTHFLAAKTVDGKRVLLPACERPTLAQFKYHVSKILEPGDIERATKGDAAWERNRAERTGFSKDIPYGPGNIFQIDATVANVYLRSRSDPSLLVGRPVFYLVTDQASGMIVGFTVAIGNASWDVAKLALENTFIDKVKSCAAAGVEISAEDWPCHHVPTQLTGDRGWDVLGVNASNSGFSLGFVVANLPPYRPDLKALVENKFQWIDVASVKWLPGATHGRQRGDLDDRPNKLDGFFDLDMFRKFMIVSILRHNSVLKVKKPPTWYPLAAKGYPSPLKIWNYGCIHRGVPNTQPERLIRASLLPMVDGKLTDQGLKVGRLLYAPVDPDERRIFNRNPGRKWETIKVRHDPRDVSTVLIQDVGGEFSTFPLVPHERRYKGWSLEEVTESRALTVALDSQSEDNRMANELRFRDKIAALNREARLDAKAKLANLDRPASVKRKINLSADKNERARESRERKHEEAWTSQSGPSAKPPPSRYRPPPRPPAPPRATPAVEKVPLGRIDKSDVLDMAARKAATKANDGEKR